MTNLRVFSVWLADLFSKFLLGYKFFIRSPKNWIRPSRCDILFFDVTGLEVFIPYMQGYSINVLYTRGERVNIYALLISLFSKKFLTGKLLSSYFQTFVKICEPKLVLTFIDESPYFHSLSRECNVLTMFVQNGIRTKAYDIFKAVDQHIQKKNSVDYMLVFGDYIGLEYKKILCGQAISIGSFKNNSFVTSSTRNFNTVVFVSQWLADVHEGVRTSFLGEDGRRVSYEEFYHSEFEILPTVLNWCKSQGILLEVLGRNIDRPREEREFFDSILTTDSYSFVPAAPFPSAYERTDSAQLVVFIDSALGYENLARSKRVACFSCRGSNYDDSSRNFGFSSAVPLNGPFWTNSNDESEVLRILDYVWCCSNEEWTVQVETYVPRIMAFDPLNTKFNALLHDIIRKSSVGIP